MRVSLSDTKVTQLVEDALTEVSFGEWLKRQRGAKGWTQQQLAQQINCSTSALRKMEAEERRPSVPVIERLAELFNIPQNEQKSFVKFARGDWQAISSPSGKTEELPWHISGVAPRSNLPAPITSFIGREKEIDEITNLITKNRLVTLVGTGGIGKTSLSLQVGYKLLNEYSNGTWFIALDSLSDSTLVPQTVAAVFDIRETPGRQVVEILTSVLREKTTLLILDNCEHLLEACAQLITTLLQSCPNVKILATSREVLNVTGEAIYQMPSLSIPAHSEASLEKLTEYESIRLFTDRASLALSSFVLTNENAQAVIDICRKVEGIPLAIELAAARVNMLQVAEILYQLQNSLALLSTDHRETLSHHLTLKASLDWSWGLLNDTEQKFMRQLSVFAGGWTLEAAQAVCEGNALNLIVALVKKSLIMVGQESGRETRYRFHEIVHQYAREKLIESSEKENIRTQHLNYFLRVSEQAEPALKGPTQMEWMSRLNDERDNIRTALEWADKTDLEAGLYLSGRLTVFWEIFDMRGGAHWLEEFIQKPESKAYPHARAKALCTLGGFMSGFQREAEGRSFAQEGLGLYRTCGDKYGEIDGLLVLASVVNPSEAGQFTQQALTLSQSINDRWRTAYALYSSGWQQDRHSSIEKALALFQEVGDLRYMAECMRELGRLEMLNNDIESAQKILNEAVSLFRKLNIKSGMSGILQSYGRIAARKGDYEQAYISLQEGGALDEKYGYRVNYFFARTHLGYLALYRGNITEAHEIFTETVRSFFKDKNEIGVVFTLEGMAGLSVVAGKLEIAARLIGWADANREKIGDLRLPLEQADVDKIIAACIATMGETAFSDVYEEGKKMSIDEAVNYALGDV